MKRYLLASDFDQTLSFNDSGIVLSELLGISGFREKSAGLSRIHLVQQGAELAYLLLHDPEYRRVRKEHLIEVGKRIRLKQNLHLLPRLLGQLDGYDFAFYVISAAPQEVIQSALEDIVPPEHIFGTRFRYAPASGEIQAIERVTAGYGEVALLEDIVGMDANRSHALFESHGLVLQEWDKVQTDLLTIRETDAAPPLVAELGGR